MPVLNGRDATVSCRVIKSRQPDGNICSRKVTFPVLLIVVCALFVFRFRTTRHHELRNSHVITYK